MRGNAEFTPDPDDLAEEYLDAMKAANGVQTLTHLDIVGFWADDEEDDTPAWYREQYEESKEPLTF